MFKKLKTKKLISLLLVFLLSINNFASIVSDSDGSAFITKGEFDVLKANFNEQIDNYISSIDGKIDGAVASYIAGLKVNNQEYLDEAVSNISYPLYFYMKDPKLDLSTWNTNGATPYWAPSWHTFLWGVRHASCFCNETDLTQPTIIDWFYNGEWDTSKSKYKINGIISNYSAIISLNGWFYRYSATHSNEPYVTFGFCLDQTQADSPRRSLGTAVTKRNYIKASGYDIVTVQQDTVLNNNLKVEAIWDWRSSTPLTISSSDASNEKYLDTMKAYYGGYLEANNPALLTVSPTVKFDTVLINKIYNANDASGKMIEVPVAYNNNVYVTQKNNFKSDLMKGSRIVADYWNGTDYTTAADHNTNWGFGNFITPAWTLEPQFSTLKNSAGADHPKENRSLMEPSDMYYEVTTPYTRAKLEQVLSDGVLVTEAEKDLKSLEINLELDIENNVSDKYICFSMLPISEKDYNNISGSDYIDIADNRAMSGIDKKIKLKAGNNRIFIGNVAKNSKIYYKILWDESDTSYVAIKNRPIIIGEKSE